MTSLPVVVPCYYLSQVTVASIPLFQQTLRLEPSERFSIEECLNHVSFQTERLLNRSNHVPVKHIDSHTTTKKRKTDFSDHVNR